MSLFMMMTFVLGRRYYCHAASNIWLPFSPIIIEAAFNPPDTTIGQYGSGRTCADNDIVKRLSGDVLVDFSHPGEKS